MASVDVIVCATAVHWSDDAFPGWIEVAVIDRPGREHRIRDKVPVLTTLPVTRDTPLPFELWLRAEARRTSADDVEIAFSEWVATVDDSPLARRRCRRRGLALTPVRPATWSSSASPATSPPTVSS